MCFCLFLLTRAGALVPNAGGGPLSPLLQQRGRLGSTKQDGMDRVVARLDGFIEAISNSSLPIVHSSAQGVFNYANTQVGTFSLEGVLFLATNIPFFAAAQILRSSSGSADVLLATSLAPALDISAVLSFLYHYAQLQFGANRAAEVKRFLLFDYVSAFFTCCIVTLEVFPFLWRFSEQTSFRLEPALCGLLSVGALLQSWKCDGRQYLAWHGLWHVLSAYTCVLLVK